MKAKKCRRCNKRITRKIYVLRDGTGTIRGEYCGEHCAFIAAESPGLRLLNFSVRAERKP